MKVCYVLLFVCSFAMGMEEQEQGPKVGELLSLVDSGRIVKIKTPQDVKAGELIALNHGWWEYCKVIKAPQSNDMQGTIQTLVNEKLVTKPMNFLNLYKIGKEKITAILGQKVPPSVIKDSQLGSDSVTINEMVAFFNNRTNRYEYAQVVYMRLPMALICKEERGQGLPIPVDDLYKLPDYVTYEIKKTA